MKLWKTILRMYRFFILYCSVINIYHPSLIEPVKNNSKALYKKSWFKSRDVCQDYLINPIPHGIFNLQVPRGGFHPPLKNPLRVVFVNKNLIPAKVLYNCRSHAKGESQEVKIEEIEELWNSRQKSEKKIRSQRNVHNSVNFYSRGPSIIPIGHCWLEYINSLSRINYRVQSTISERPY